LGSQLWLLEGSFGITEESPQALSRHIGKETWHAFGVAYVQKIKPTNQQ